LPDAMILTRIIDTIIACKREERREEKNRVSIHNEGSRLPSTRHGTRIRAMNIATVVERSSSVVPALESVEAQES